MFSVNEEYRIVIYESMYPDKKRIIFTSEQPFPFKPSIDQVEKAVNELKYKYNKEKLIIKVKKEYKIVSE